MQTLIHVYCRPGESLRRRIALDERLANHRLEVVVQQIAGRKPGWLKVHSSDPDRPGAINIEWDGNTYLLTCRVVTRNRNKPNLIVGDFLEYLLACQWSRIEQIVVAPR